METGEARGSIGVDVFVVVAFCPSFAPPAFTVDVVVDVATDEGVVAREIDSA